MRRAADRPAAYPILEVRTDWQPAQPAPEPMGSKRKFWFRSDAAGGRDCLFKYPRSDTGEHWAEKIAAEVASALGIRHARVDLAAFQGHRGSATESFARGGRELHRGNDLLEGAVYGYDPKKRFGQSSHTLGNIWAAMNYAFVDPGTARRAKAIIADGGSFSSALARLRRLDPATIAAIVDRIPDDWMSPPARTFAMALLCYNLNELRDLAP